MSLSSALAAAQGGMSGFGAGGMMGGMMPAPQITGAMKKVFGDHPAFSATVETQTTGAADINVPGKLAVDERNSRFELDLSKAAGKQVPPETTAQLKALGMDQMIIIHRPDKKAFYMVYPVMQAYIETALPHQPAEAEENAYKLKSTEIAKETVAGHPTTKNKIVVSDGTNAVYEATVWNASDLKNFPVKIEQSDGGTRTVITFKNVKLEKPSASLFEVPANSKKYNSMMEMMQEMVMKQMGGMGAPGAPKAR